MDQKLLFLINREWTSPALDRLMAVMSSAAFWTIPLVIAGIATLIWGGFKGRTFVILALVAFALSDGVVGRVLKRSVNRLRPHQTQVGVRMIDLDKPAYTGIFRPLKDKLSLGTGRNQEGRSFPSNHASNTAAVALLTCLFWRRWGWLAFIPSLSVAYSRVYVGSHWPSDALAGVCIGFAVALFVLALAETAWRRWGALRWPQIARTHPSLLSA
jgi:membrane-associated phospholipid phosphatase